jgi:hypothetical protein
MNDVYHVQSFALVYLSLKGLNAAETHNDLVVILKIEAKAYSTVAYYLPTQSFSSPKTPQPSESPAPILNELDEAILLPLSEEPFASVRQLARRTYTLPWSTTISCTSLGSPFDIFVGSHTFWRKLTSTPEHNFRLNSSRCSRTRKTERCMTL